MVSHTGKQKHQRHQGPLVETVTDIQIKGQQVTACQQHAHKVNRNI